MVNQWKTIRVFISSTFRDTHFERDALTRIVFPELRAWCEERFIHIAELDLRWGVTQEESAAGKAIEICLNEIDRSDIFLCLIGSRYGWIPDEYEVGNEEKFSWIDDTITGHSITELEIMRGVLNHQEHIAPKLSHALFYFRDEMFLEDIKGNNTLLCELTDGSLVSRSGKKCFEPDNHKANKLKELKSKIRNQKDKGKGHGKNDIKISVTEDYPSMHHQSGERLLADDDSQQMAVEFFCQKVLSDLKQAIDEAHPEMQAIKNSKVSDTNLDKRQYEAYLERQTHNFQGRKDYIDKVVDFAMKKNGSEPLVITGEAGLGKTSILLKACGEMEERISKQMEGKNKIPILVRFFAGYSPGSLQTHNMLRCLILQLRDNIARIRPRRQVDYLWAKLKASVQIGSALTLSGKMNKQQKPVISPSEPAELAGSFQELSEYFQRLLVEACSYAERVILILDNLDHMVRDQTQALSLQWLPAKLPSNLRLIIVADDCSSSSPETMRPDSPLQMVAELDLSGFSDDMVSNTSANYGSDVENEYQSKQVGISNQVFESVNALFRSSYETLCVGGLLEEEAMNLVSEILKNYGKKLDTTQTKLLMENPSSKNPTWLVIACEELRVFKYYEQVTERVTDLPNDIPNLLDQFINRIEKDHGAKFVQDCLCIIVCSRDGLYEHEIVEILGVPQTAWSQLFYSIKPFLRSSSNNGDDEIIAFSHRDLTISLVSRYFKDSNMKLMNPFDRQNKITSFDKIHTRLATYHKDVVYGRNGQKWNSKRSRGLRCLPYHQLHARLYKELESTLTDLRFIEAYCEAGLGFGWVDDLSRALQACENAMSVQFLHGMGSISGSPQHQNQRRMSFRPLSRPGTTMVNERSRRSISTAPQPVISSSFFGSTEDNRIPLEIPEIEAIGGHQTPMKNLSNELNYEDSLIFSASLNRSYTYESQGNETPSQSMLPRNQYRNPISIDMVKRLRDFQEFAQAYAHELVCYPHLVFQYAANLPDENLASISAQQLWEKEPEERNAEKRTWLKWLNKPQESGPCIMQLTGHMGPVLCCRFSRDGKRIVSGSADCSVRVWMFQSGENIARLEGHKGPVVAVDISPVDNELVLSASADGTARVWVKGIQSLIFMRHDINFIKKSDTSGKKHLSLTCCAISENGKMAATGDASGVLLVWNIATMHVIQTLQGFKMGVSQVKFAANDTAVYASGYDLTVRGWVLDTGSMFMCKSGTGLGINTLFATASEHAHFALRTSSMKIKLYSAAEYLNRESSNKISDENKYHRSSEDENLSTYTSEEIALANKPRKPKNLARVTIDDVEAHLVKCCDISRSNRVASGRADGTIAIYETNSGKVVCNLHGHIGQVNDLCYDITGRYIVSASNDHIVRIWNPYQARMVGSNPHKSSIRKCGFSPGSKMSSILSLSEEGVLSMWKIDSKFKHYPIKQEPRRNILIDASFTPSGDKFAVLDTRLRICPFAEKEKEDISKSTAVLQEDFSNSRISKVRELPQDNIGIWRISPCERVVVIVESGGRGFHLWNTTTNPMKKICTVTTGHQKPINACVFAKDGYYLYTAGSDGKICVWDIVKASNFHRETSKNASKKSPREAVELPEIIPLRVLCDPKDLGVASLINNVFESPNGHALLSISDGPDLKHWDLEAVMGGNLKGNQIATSMFGHSNRVTCASWAPHGQNFVSASTDGCIKIWHSESLFCQRTIDAHISHVVDVQYLADGVRVVSISVDRACYIWSAQTGTQLNAMIFSSPVTTMAVSPVGNVIVVGSKKGDMRILEVMNRPLTDQSKDVKEVSLSRLEKECVGNPPPFVLPIKIVKLIMPGLNRWTNKCIINCPYCSSAFPVKGKSLNDIRREEYLSRMQGFSESSLEDSKLVIRCEFCREKLRLVPFALDRSGNQSKNDFEGNLSPKKIYQKRKRFTQIMKQKEIKSIDKMKEIEEEKSPASETENKKDYDADSDAEINRQEDVVFRQEIRKSRMTSFYDTTFHIHPFNSRDYHKALPSVTKQKAKNKKSKSKKMPKSRSESTLALSTAGSSRRASQMMTAGSSRRASQMMKSTHQVHVVPRGYTPIASQNYKWLTAFSRESEETKYEEGSLKEDHEGFLEADCMDSLYHSRINTSSCSKFFEPCATPMADNRFLELEGPLIRRCNTASAGARRKNNGNFGSSDKVLKSTTDLRIEDNTFNIVHGINPGNQIDALQRALGGTTLRVRPRHVNFGMLCVRSLYRFPVTLLNVSSTTVRFRIALEHNPRISIDHTNTDSEVVKQNFVTVVQSPDTNPLVSGLKSTVYVEIETHIPGEIKAMLRISTDSGELFSSPVRATVLSTADYFVSCSTKNVTHDDVIVVSRSKN